MTSRTGAGRPSQVAGARPASPSVWILRLLLTGPRDTRSSRARRTVTVLAIAGAVLLVWSAVIHLRLWNEGYSGIPTIGPLFLAQGIGGLVVAAALVAFRRLALLGAGAVTLAATAGGLLASAHGGFFGYQESLAVPYAESSLVIEFTGAGVLVVAAVILLAAARSAAARPAARSAAARAGGTDPFPAAERK